MKRLLFLIALLLVSFAIRAQISVKEGSFKEAGQFFTMKEDMTDDNYTPYAVIRVRGENMTPEQILQLGFQGDARTYIEVEPQENEVWVYLTYLATYLKITHPDLSSTEFTIPYDLEPLHGYELVLVSGASANDEGKGAITIVTNPEGASIAINGIAVNEITPYHNEFMPAGRYEISVSKYGFKTVTKTIVVKSTDNQCVDIDLPMIYGKIDVVSEPRGTIVFIDGQKYGETPIVINDVQIGNHELSLKKDGYISVIRNINVNESFEIKLDEKLKECPLYAINGLFTVNDKGKQVCFSTGNLQYILGDKIWKFAEKQYEIAGAKNKDALETGMGVIDLFGWGTGNNPTKTSNDNTDYNSFYDWGNNNIINGGNSRFIWRTLTIDEWQYLLETRKTLSGIRYAKAQIIGINGLSDEFGVNINVLVLLPDDWSECYYYFRSANESNSTFSSNKITIEDYANIEKNGGVFLPVCGKRSGLPIEIAEFNSYGFYWSSSTDSIGFANALCFFSGVLGVHFRRNPGVQLLSKHRCNGYAVRLICEYNNAVFSNATKKKNNRTKKNNL